MSNMLEQAIVDAKTLREAALRNAETAIVEKYSGEVKEAVQKLLEQDEIADDPMLGDMGGPETDDSTAMEQVPMAHLSDEEEIVVVDLDDIVAAAEEDTAEESEEDETFTLDRSEIADEVGIDLDTDDAPANRDDDLEINEEELVDIFKEMLTVDVPAIEVTHSEEEAEEDDAEETEEKEMVHTDGMTQDDIDEYYRTMAKNENLQQENKNLKKIINKFKKQLQETNLHNARLLYTNRVLSTTSLNEQQKAKIVDMVQNSRSITEAKTVYETLQKTMAGDSTKRSSSQSLSEAVTKPSSVILGHRPRNSAKSERNPTVNRWATLAGLKTNKD
jgi:hypothetical protein